MSKEKNQNKSLTNYEEQNQQLVNALYAQKLVKPTCSDCEDYFSAMVSILTKRGFEQESFERELRKCEEKMKKCLEDSANPYFLWLVHNCQACWLSTPVDVATPGSEDYDTWSYYMYSNDVKAYLITVNEKVEKVAYPKCLEVLRKK